MHAGEQPRRKTTTCEENSLYVNTEEEEEEVVDARDIEEGGEVSLLSETSSAVLHKTSIESL